MGKEKGKQMEYVFGALFLGALVLSYYLKNFSLEVNHTFGVPLEKVAMHQPSGVPVVVYDCITYLHSYHAAQMKGVFKEVGDRRLLSGLVKSYNRGDRLVSEKVDVHTVATLLGLFFRQLPAPIMGSIEEMLAVERRHGEDEDAWKEAMRGYLLGLPLRNRTTISFVFEFLHEMHILEEVNQVKIGTLAYLWMQNLQCMDASDTKLGLRTIARCIVHSPSLFPQ